MTAQLFLVAFVTLRKVPKNGSEILGREQTEEWKGWMQFSFLMYQCVCGLHKSAHVEPPLRHTTAQEGYT